MILILDTLLNSRIPSLVSTEATCCTINTPTQLTSVFIFHILPGQIPLHFFSPKFLSYFPKLILWDELYSYQVPKKPHWYFDWNCTHAFIHLGKLIALRYFSPARNTVGILTYLGLCSCVLVTFSWFSSLLCFSFCIHLIKFLILLWMGSNFYLCVYCWVCVHVFSFQLPGSFTRIQVNLLDFPSKPFYR